MTDYGLHWFRRDLRIAGNPGLQYQFQTHKKNVVGVFCFDKDFLGRSDFSYNRFQLFLESIKSLKKELQSYGSDLIVLDIGPEIAFKELFANVQDLPKTITFGRDYEPFALKRDKEMTQYFENLDIDVKSFRDHLLIEPHELEKKVGEGYQVYSPFARKWLEIFQSEVIEARVKAQENGLNYLENKLQNKKIEPVFDFSWDRLFKNQPLKDYLDQYIEENAKKCTINIPETGSLAAYKLLKKFLDKADKYNDSRDFPAINGTSRLAMYLKNGSITISQIIAYLNLSAYKKKENGKDVFLSELIWREFYYHILFRNPRVENEAFLTQYNAIKWDNNKKYFQAWKDGMTGFPIVDAGMRELKMTGHMHNRVRMIVASFLTKDLLINWQWGEKYFMETLLDGDLAANNGGWQWAASTGCDPQPYFRIFNPWLQSKKFDPDGVYIKEFLPELKELDPKKLHSPIIDHKNYPSPIVEHKEQREKALEMYKAVRN